LLLPRIEQSLYITTGQEMPPKLPLPVGAFIEHIVPWTYPSVYHKQHIHFPRAHSHNLQTHTHTTYTQGWQVTIFLKLDRVLRRRMRLRGNRNGEGCPPHQLTRRCGVRCSSPGEVQAEAT